MSVSDFLFRLLGGALFWTLGQFVFARSLSEPNVVWIAVFCLLGLSLFMAAAKTQHHEGTFKALYEIYLRPTRSSEQLRERSRCLWRTSIMLYGMAVVWAAVAWVVWRSGSILPLLAGVSLSITMGGLLGLWAIGVNWVAWLLKR